jgi:hypothetical protein
MPGKFLKIMAFCAWAAIGRAETGFFAGPLYSDNSSIQGYAMPVESARLLKPGQGSWDLGFNVANYFTYESQSAGWVEQIFEEETWRLGLAYGFEWGLPWEIRLKSALSQSHAGFMNGFIGGTEQFLYRSTGGDFFLNPYRSGPDALAGDWDEIHVDGHDLSRTPEQGWALADSSATLKLGWPLPERQELSARFLFNAPGIAARSNGAFAGLGLAWTWTLTQRLALQLDGRGELPFQNQNGFGLALKPFFFGWSSGLEWSAGGLGFGFLRLPEKFSLGFQINSAQSPYQQTGLRAFDAQVNDITLGLHYGFAVGERLIVWELWGREDFSFDSNSPFLGTNWLPYAPPDFQAGLGLTLK